MTVEEVAHLLCVNFNQDAKSSVENPVQYFLTGTNYEIKAPLLTAVIDFRDNLCPPLTASLFRNNEQLSLAVGHANGYILYKTSDALESSVLLDDADNSAAIHEAIIVERLFNSSLVVIVSQKEPRVMHIYHFKSKNMICDYKFTKSVLNVKLNRDRVVVCVEDSIFIYTLKDMKPLHTILDTPLNRLGLIDLSPEASCLIAYPASAEAGSVHIFDCMNLSAVNTFTAHDGPLACLKFNADGTMIATASIKGTVIRVYSVPQGTRLFEFRRGMSRCVTIYSLAFSADSTYLCSSSNTETVHVFKLEKPEDQEKKQESTAESSSGWLGYLTQAASSYLPTQVNELMTVERSFATAILPGSDKKNVAAMPTIKGQPHLLVATTDGFLYCYRILSTGGECDLVKMHRIGVNATETNRTESSRASNAESGARVPDANDPEDFPPICHTTG